MYEIPSGHDGASEGLEARRTNFYQGIIMKTAQKNLSGKIVSIIFTIIMAFYFFYQIVLGNPFFDDVSPTILTGLFFVLGVLGILVAFRKS
jgi:hypothetical protein